MLSAYKRGWQAIWAYCLATDSYRIRTGNKTDAHRERAVLRSYRPERKKNEVVPLTGLASTHCGYSKPIGLLIWGVIIILGTLISSVVTGEGIFIL